MLRSVSVPIWLLVLLFAVWLRLSEGPGECPHDPEACFFSDSYDNARARFQKAAKDAGAELHSLPLGARTPGLTVDVAVLGANSKGYAKGAPLPDAPTMVHISGTHGVEGHVGSAIQLALLEQWRIGAAEPPAGVRIVLVHALNPFGFKHGRRWNEDNIDLNRNFLPEDTFPGTWSKLNKTGGAGKPIYEQFEHLWNWQHGWGSGPKWLQGLGLGWVPGVGLLADEAWYWARLVYTLAIHNFNDVKRAIVTGQYYHPSGMYYGGNALSASHTVLLESLRSICSDSAGVIVLDVHSGLGPPGVDTLMMAIGLAPGKEGEGSSDVAERADALFASPSWGERGVDFLAGPNSDAAAGYDMAIGTMANLQRAMPGWKRAFQVTQEFGTVPGVLVVRALTIEQAEWAHRGGTAMGAKAAKAAFYVKTQTWQKKVVRRGLELARQALEALGSETKMQDIPLNSAARDSPSQRVP